jgi:hypothetical protein
MHFWYLMALAEFALREMVAGVVMEQEVQIKNFVARLEMWCMFVRENVARVLEIRIDHSAR